MLELRVPMAEAAALAECRRRGLVVRIERGLAGHPDGRHWHFAMPGCPGTLELSAWDEEVWVKVHPLRDGGWAGMVASQMASAKGTPPALDPEDGIS